MRLSGLFHIRKSRKYPIKRDGEGLSLRARCFVLFEQGKRPGVVAEELKMEASTTFRYFRDWKQLGSNLEVRYAYARSLFKKTAPNRDNNIELFARTLGIQKEEFETFLSQPHGLRRLMTGKLYFPAHVDADHKLHIALKLSVLISEHLIKNGGKFHDVYYAISRYMHEYKRYREDVDADIQEWNKEMEFFRVVLAADIENERKSRVKPSVLSAEERDAMIRWGIEAKFKDLQNKYHPLKESDQRTTAPSSPQPPLPS
jgi:hypothetical protein